MAQLFPHPRFSPRPLFTALSLLLLPACGPDPVWSGSECCACLIGHAPDGAYVIDDVNSDDDLGENCLAAEGSFQRQNLTCSNEVSLFVVEGEGHVQTSDPSCGVQTCASECAAAMELGLRVAPADDGDGDETESALGDEL
mgnify:CR=1 FL=1